MKKPTTCGLRIRDHKWRQWQVSVGGRVVKSVKKCRRCHHEITATVEGWQPYAPLTADDVRALIGSGIPYPLAPERTVSVDQSAEAVVRYIQQYGGITVDNHLGPQTWAVLTKEKNA